VLTRAVLRRPRRHRTLAGSTSPLSLRARASRPLRSSPPPHPPPRSTPCTRSSDTCGRSSSGARRPRCWAACGGLGTRLASPGLSGAARRRCRSAGVCVSLRGVLAGCGHARAVSRAPACIGSGRGPSPALVISQRRLASYLAQDSPRTCCSLQGSHQFQLQPSGQRDGQRQPPSTSSASSNPNPVSSEGTATEQSVSAHSLAQRQEGRAAAGAGQGMRSSEYCDFGRTSNRRAPQSPSSLSQHRLDTRAALANGAYR